MKKNSSKLHKLLYPLKIKKENWYSFDHSNVNKMFEGGLTFLNYFCLGNENRPVAVYKVKKPNKSKGHKKYLLLQPSFDNKSLIIRGMNSREMSIHRLKQAIHCLICNNVIYSVSAHHFNTCDCGNCSIDGGALYYKYATKDENKLKQVVIDLLTDKIVDRGKNNV